MESQRRVERQCGKERHSGEMDGRNTFGVSDSSPRPDRTAQGSTAGRVKSPGLLGVETSAAGWWKKLGDSQDSPLKGPETDLGLKQTHSLWAPALEQQLKRAPVAYGENLKCLASGRVPKGSFLLDKTPEARQQHCSLSESSPHRATDWQHHIRDSISMVHTGCPVLAIT